MLLWVGLGNPGAKYVRAGTISADGRPVKVLLLKPTTFMNESGRAVQKAMQFYKIPLDNVTVFHDELDIAPGKFRMKIGGGIAGHNGRSHLSYHRAYYVLI